MNIKYILLLLSISITNLAIADTFNVKDFGAKGDGITDDHKSIQACIAAAIKGANSTILFPYGTFKVSQPLEAFFEEGDIKFLGVLGRGNKKSTIFTDKIQNILMIQGYPHLISRGSCTVENISLKGVNPPYTNHHPYANKNEMFQGLLITNKKQAVIKNVSIYNIYGQGIQIFNTKATNIEDEGRFDNVTIISSEIFNCWGSNPTTDSYGDGIYIADVKSANIKDNKIINDILVTKQLGRAGIVIEYLAENCKVIDNEVRGYDRPLHIESSYGGHLISNNKLYGSDMGIDIFEPLLPGGKKHNKPIIIENNVIGNLYMYKGVLINRARGRDDFGSRSLLNFRAEDGSRAGSVISNNKFVVDGGYAYESNSITHISANGILMNGNNYIVKNLAGVKYSINYHNASDAVIKKEAFVGVANILLRKKDRPGETVNSFKLNNFVSQAQIRIE